MRDYPSERVDLRSDTVTQPTELMRQLMASAEVGDDVMGDDPTVNTLQEKVAKMLGKEAGLFISSGTMGNAVAILAHTRPGDEIVAYTKSHIFRYEARSAGVSVTDGLVEKADDAPLVAARNARRTRRSTKRRSMALRTTSASAVRSDAKIDISWVERVGAGVVASAMGWIFFMALVGGEIRPKRRPKLRRE